MKGKFKAVLTNVKSFLKKWLAPELLFLVVVSFYFFSAAIVHGLEAIDSGFYSVSELEAYVFDFIDILDGSDPRQALIGCICVCACSIFFAFISQLWHFSRLISDFIVSKFRKKST